MQDDVASPGWYPVNQLVSGPIIQRLDQYIPAVQNDLDFLFSPRISAHSAGKSICVRRQILAGRGDGNGHFRPLGQTRDRWNVKHISIIHCKNKKTVVELKHWLQSKMNNEYNIIPHETVVH